MPHQIRPMQRSDLDAVMAVQAVCYPAPMQEARAVLEARLHAAAATCVVGCDDAGICGYLFAYPSRLGAVTDLDAPFAPAADPDTLYLHDLSVAPRALGRGLARALVECSLTKGRAAGWHHAALVSVQDSARFWAGLGFRPVTPVSGGLVTYPVGALYMVRPLQSIDS